MNASGLLVERISCLRPLSKVYKQYMGILYECIEHSMTVIGFIEDGVLSKSLYRLCVFEFSDKVSAVGIYYILVFEVLLGNG